MEDRTIDVEVDGLRFISHGHYYDGINNWLCHKLKENDPQALAFCARQLVKMLPENAVLVPIPGHYGFAFQTLYLARAISAQSNGKIPVANLLKGNSRVSNYQAKKEGHPLSAEELGFHQVRKLPKGKVPYLLDNVVDTGTTAKAAVKALGGGIVLSYAMSNTLLESSLNRRMLLR
jgi:predicted amidophosphoribosyltransferase